MSSFETVMRMLQEHRRDRLALTALCAVLLDSPRESAERLGKIIEVMNERVAQKGISKGDRDLARRVRNLACEASEWLESYERRIAA